MAGQEGRGGIPDLKHLPTGATRLLLEPELGHPVRIPVHLLRGERPGPRLLITAGVHGAEYASIAAANQLARLDPSQLSGTLAVLPVVNPPSFFARSIYLNPVDGQNLNRMFPGDPSGSFASRLAHWLGGWMSQADAYLDLHGGDLIEQLTPFSLYPAGQPASAELAGAFGLPWMLADSGTTMSVAAASRLGLPAVLAEAGGNGLWPEAAVSALYQGTLRVMAKLGMWSGPALAVPTPPRQLSSFAWLRAEAAGFWHPAVQAGDQVEKGQTIGYLTDLLGEPVSQALSPEAGVVLFIVTSLAMNANDPLVGIGTGSR